MEVHCKLLLQDDPHKQVKRLPGFMISANMKETQKRKMEQLSADKLQLNKEVDYDRCQLSGARKVGLSWQLNHMPTCNKCVFPEATVVSCLKIDIIGRGSELFCHLF